MIAANTGTPTLAPAPAPATSVTVDAGSRPNTLLRSIEAPAETLASLTTSVASIVAPPPSDELDDNLSTCSPAVSALLLASNAPSVSPVVSATTVVRVPLPVTPETETSAAAGMPKAKVERVKPQMGMNGGRWTEQEHQSFLAGLRLYGREWKKVASKIKTRTSAQIRSHAQKYFAKLARDDEMRRHNGLLPLPEGGASTQPGGSIFGYYSDDGSSTAMNSGDDGGDTDSSTCQPAASADFMSKMTRPSGGAHAATAPFPDTGAASASTLAALFSSSAPSQEANSQTKKRARTASAFGTAMSLQPLAAAKTVSNPCKQRKVAAKSVGGVAQLPSQEELLEKVSPTIRQRLSSLIEAELCALQVLSCSALLQRQGGVPRDTQAAAHTGLLGFTASLPVAASSAGTTAPFAGQPAMGLTMIATEQIPSMSSIY